MKKILGVAFIGGLLLFVALWYAGRDRAPAIGPEPAVASAALPALPAAQPVAPPSVPVAPVIPVVAAGTTEADTAACARLSGLCSTSDDKVDPAQCQKQLTDARKMAGAANVDRSEQCLTEAKTCAAASGCLSGGVGMGAMGEFLKGLGGALSR